MIKRLPTTALPSVFVAILAMLPLHCLANTGTPPTLTISKASPASVNPVAVGDASSGPSTTVSFSVDVTSGNERNEAGPIKIKSQTYTINASPGVITGVSHPTGYTPKIATGGGSATVTGNGASSFDIAVTVYYPPSAAGFNTVSCTGKLTMTDNTPIPGNTVGFNVTAVAITYSKISGTDSKGDASANVTVKPSESYTNWSQTVDTAIADQSTSPGAATNSITMKLNENSLKGGLGGNSTIKASVSLPSGSVATAQTTGTTKEIKVVHSSATLVYEFLGSGIGVREFPSEVDCDPYKASYGVSSSGYLSVINKMSNINSPYFWSNLDYTSLAQVGAGVSLAANGSLAPNNVTFGLSNPVRPQILPPNTEVYEGGPASNWWYNTNATGTATWSIVAITASGAVPGIPVTDSVTVNLP